MDTIKNVPGMLAEGYKQVKILAESVKAGFDGKAMGIADRFMAIADEYMKLSAEAEAQKQKAEGVVDDVFAKTEKKTEGNDQPTVEGPKVVAKEARARLRAEAPQAMAESAPSGDIPSNLANVVKAKAGKPSTLESAQAAMAAGAGDVKALREIAGEDFNQFAKLVERYVEKFPPGLV